jgi:hypothetical protein
MKCKVDTTHCHSMGCGLYFGVSDTSVETAFPHCHIGCKAIWQDILAKPCVDFMMLTVTDSQEILFVMVMTLQC